MNHNLDDFKNSDIDTLTIEIISGVLGRLGGVQNLVIDFTDWINQGIDAELFEDDPEFISQWVTRSIKRRTNTEIGLLGSYYELDNSESGEIITIEIPYKSMMIVEKSFETYVESIIDDYELTNSSKAMLVNNRDVAAVETISRIKAIIGQERIDLYISKLTEWLVAMYNLRVNSILNRPHLWV